MGLSYTNMMIASAGLAMYFGEVLTRTFYDYDLSGSDMLFTGLAGVVLGAGIKKVLDSPKMGSEDA